LVEVGQSGRAVYEALLGRGVIVRPMPAPLDKWLRVTVGRPDENQRFLASLEHVLRDRRA
jgi:histidinol-phosphate aminotransferase